MRCALRVLALLLAAPLAARAASTVSNEVSVTRSDVTSGNPRPGSVADAVRGSVDVGEDWSLLLGGQITVQQETPAPDAGEFADRGGTVGLLSAGAEYEASDSWVFGATVDWSPQSTTRQDTSLTLTGPRGSSLSYDALLRTRSWNLGAQLTTTWSSPDLDADVQWAVTGGLTLSHFDQDQAITAVYRGGSVRTAQEIRDNCRTTAKCSRALLSALREAPANLDSAKLSATADVTLFRDTDVGLGADYWAYAQDPNEVGFFSVGQTGRVAASGGNGVPIAPLRWQVRPEVAQRFGPFSLRLAGFYGEYVSGAAQGTAGASLRAQYKFTREFRAWLTVSGQRDVSDDQSASVSRSASLGLAYRF